MASGAPTLKRVQSLARRVLDEQPDAIVSYRLLRDVLQVDVNSTDVRRAKRAMLASRQVRALAKEQLADGSWGRLHSANTKVRRATPTTEAGVARALDLGLDHRDTILRSAAAYLGRVLRGAARIPDPPEKNSRWPAGVEMFAGGTLALVEPRAAALDELFGRWSAVLARSFASAVFDPEAELQAQHEIHNVDLREGVGYLGLANRYAVALLASRAGALPARVRRAYADWLWRNPDGLGYLNQPALPRARMPASNSRAIVAWLRTLERLACFDLPRVTVRPAILWLWNQRKPDGLWDFGPRAVDLRLSASWRYPAARRHDHSAHALLTLSQLLRSQNRAGLD